MKTKEIHVGNLVKQSVKQSNYTFAEVAKMAGISRQTFNGWLKKSDWSVKDLFTISNIIQQDIVKYFCLPSAEQQETKVILQISVDKDKTNEVLNYVKDKQLYNLIKN
jgi:predicted transcriptional regulator